MTLFTVTDAGSVEAQVKVRDAGTVIRAMAAAVLRSTNSPRTPTDSPSAAAPIPRKYSSVWSGKRQEAGTGARRYR
jgi:hypothetical protein